MERARVADTLARMASDEEAALARGVLGRDGHVRDLVVQLRRIVGADR